MKRIKTIDAEVAGEAVRLVVNGAPSVPGRTMVEKLAWVRKHGGELRKLLMLEPRGHGGMHGAILTEPVSAGAHAGLLSMHAAGFAPVSGEGIIAAVTIALENGLIEGVTDHVVVDTPVGVFRASPQRSGARVSSVALTGVPSFVKDAGVRLRVGSRHVTVDIAFGGESYAISDSEAIGIPIDMSNASALARMGREITEAVDQDIQGTIFTGSPRAAADLRSATVIDGEVVRRSPGVTGTAALMAVLNAMGLLRDGYRVTHEGILGTTVCGTVTRRQHTGDVDTITPVIEASASITGFHEFVSD